MGDQGQAIATGTVTEIRKTMPGLPVGLAWSKDEVVVPRLATLFAKKPCSKDELCLDGKEILKNAGSAAYFGNIVGGPPIAAAGASLTVGSTMLRRGFAMIDPRPDKTYLVTQGGYMSIGEKPMKNLIEANILSDSLTGIRGDHDAVKNARTLAKVQAKILTSSMKKAFEAADRQGLKFYFDLTEERITCYQSGGSTGPKILGNQRWPIQTSDLNKENAQILIDFVKGQTKEAIQRRSS